MFHTETKTLLSSQLKSLLVPSSDFFVSARTARLDIFQSSYISYGHNGGTAPTHTSASASALLSSVFINLGEQQWSPTLSPPPPTTTLSHPTLLPSHEDIAFATTAVPLNPPRVLDSDYVEDA